MPVYQMALNFEIWSLCVCSDEVNEIECFSRLWLFAHLWLRRGREKECAVEYSLISIVIAVQLLSHMHRLTIKIAKRCRVRSRNALVLRHGRLTSCSLPPRPHVDGIDKGPSLFDDALTPLRARRDPRARPFVRASRNPGNITGFRTS